jgi:trehalose 6-phosphate phosphatase
LEHLLSAWNYIAQQIQAAEHVLFLSDFDGTLAPIVNRPELAVMPETTCQLLKTLTRDSRFTVGIISGRALFDLKKRVSMDGVIYAGNHGFEIEGPGLSFVNPIAEEVKPFFRIVSQILGLTLGAIKGVLVEDKGLTLSIHYRQAQDEKAGDIQALIEHAIDTLSTRGLFKVTSGKKVYEIRPAVDWDKGEAIRILMKKYGKYGRQSGLLPIYLGDDLTDEDGFRIIEKYGDGITVYVGGVNRHSAARYYLDSSDQVEVLLDKLMELSQPELVPEPWLTS